VRSIQGVCTANSLALAGTFLEICIGVIIIIIIIIIIIHQPDIIIRDNEKGTCMLIDVAISGDRSVIKKEAEDILKFKDLTIGI